VPDSPPAYVDYANPPGGRLPPKNSSPTYSMNGNVV